MIRPKMLLLAALFAGLSFPAFADDKSAPDLEGTPDLFVNAERLASQWVVRDEKIDASFCSAQEGGVTPGEHRLVRFTVMTPNRGDADVYVGNPQDHIDAGDGLFEFATCHKHYHFRHYARYELIDPATGKVWRAAKRGFCMLDTDPLPAAESDVPPGPHYYRSCGAVGVPGNQGVSHGWADTYRFFLGGQYFVLDGGDGQDPVPPGNYVIRITVNPPFVPGPGEPCPHVDGNGFCHQLEESDYSNNVAQVTITIPDQPGRGVEVGPGAGVPAAEDKDEHGAKIGSN